MIFGITIFIFDKEFIILLYMSLSDKCYDLEDLV